MSAPLLPRQHFVAAAGNSGWQRLAYLDWGDPGNPDVVVCVHGLTRNAHDFDVLAAALAPRYRVVCPDVVGRGLSDWLPNPGDYGYLRYLADSAVLLARIGVERVHWVGTSMGGILGELIAAMPHNPLRSLVLNDVGARIPVASLRSIASYVGSPPACVDLDAVAAYLARIHSGFGALTPEQWRTMAGHSARVDSDGCWRLRYDPAIGAALRGPLAEIDLGAVWAAGKLPTLVLRGAESTLLTEAILAEMLAVRPDTRTVTFPACGHAPALQDATHVAVVRDFLDAQP